MSKYPWRPAVPLAYNVGREASNTLCVVCITCLHLSLINVFLRALFSTCVTLNLITLPKTKPL